jgi:LuxR family transcriptional regulator, maltose regulon positive regulatory protein
MKIDQIASFPKLTTKLLIPGPRPVFVERPHLYERLDQCIEYRILLVAAPAGSGKTSLLSQWSRQCKWPMAWVALDAADNDPTHFWSYLVSALDRLGLPAAQNLLPLLHAPQPQTTEFIVSALVNLVASWPSHLVLVLDDYHWIENESIHTGMAYLLDYLPPNLHLIVTSRTDPPLPLGRWRAQGHLLELRVDELYFSVGETEQFLAHVLPDSFSAVTHVALHERTGGWVAGLQLAALALRAETRRNGDTLATLQNFGGDHRYLVEYLSTEVLQQQPEHLRTFLLQTAILAELNDELCTAVTGQANSQELLSQLHQRGLFIMALDRQRRYRYHDLFGDFLRAQLERELDQDVPSLHGRAASWYQTQGQVDRAIPHLFAAGRTAEAGSLIQQNARQYLMRGETATLLRWFTALPDAIIRSEPLLCLVYAWVLTNSGQVARALPYLDHVETGEDAGEDANLLLGEAAIVRARMGAMRSDQAQLITHSQRALALLPATATRLRSDLLLDLAGCHLTNREYVAAATTYCEAIELGRSAGHLRAAMLASYYWADLQLNRGQVQQAAQRYQQGLAWCRQSQPPSALACWMHAGLAALHYEWNEIATALHHAQQAIELAHQCGEVKVMMYGRMTLAQALQTQGEANEALAVLQTATEIAQQSTSVGIEQQIDLVRAKLWLRQGKVDCLHIWLQQQGVSLHVDCQPPHQLTLLAWLHLMAGDTNDQASPTLLNRLVGWLHERRETACADHLVRPVVEDSILLALAHHAHGQTGEAVRSMALAVAAAEPMGLLRTFADVPHPAVPTLLRQLPARGEPSSYVHRLLPLFANELPDVSNGHTPPSPDPLVEPLTQRELEVLHHIANGLSNQEIAREMVVALSTVKWYLRNIYGKLHVNRRTQALAEARRLNLLVSN